jgi:hypothetical protein
VLPGLALLLLLSTSRLEIPSLRIFYKFGKL